MKNAFYAASGNPQAVSFGYCVTEILMTAFAAKAEIDIDGQNFSNCKGKSDIWRVLMVRQYRIARCRALLSGGNCGLRARFLRLIYGNSYCGH